MIKHAHRDGINHVSSASIILENKDHIEIFQVELHSLEMN
jgi:hypothetical protein